jgi:hypothetical protein
MKEHGNERNCNEDIPTEIVCILDRSGSMSSIREDTIGSFNTFLKDQQLLPGKATLTLMIFDHEYEIIHNNTNINCVEPLTNKTYIPRGSTALYDAIGIAISKAESRVECGKPNKVLVTIITDGEENSSKEYNKCQIMKLIEKCKSKYGWEFLYLSASPSAFTDGASIGVSTNNIFHFQPTGKGVRGMMASYSCNTTSYRNSGSTSGFKQH